MSRTASRARRSLALAIAAAALVPAAAQARDIWATDSQNNLYRFDSLFPGTISDSTPITGLTGGVTVKGLDVRPATGELWALGSDSRLYKLDAGTAVATAVNGPFNPALTGTFFGFDFNPTVDRIRIVSDQRQNLRANPLTGGIAGVDGLLNPGTPRVVGSAYTNSSVGPAPATTTLFAVDSGSDQLLVQNPPNNGTLTDGKALGVNVGDDLGVDIAGPRNDAYIAATPSGGQGASLYNLNLATGAATAQGVIGAGNLTITAMAARQNTTSWPVGNIPPNLSIVRTTLQPKVNQNAAYIAAALDPDGLIVNVAWDTDNDGQFDDAQGFSTRVKLPAGVSTIRARATDDAGARVVSQVKVKI